MNTNAREQIRLTLEHVLEKAADLFDAQVEGHRSTHPAAKGLRSGKEIRSTLQVIESAGDAFLDQTSDNVAAIAKDTEAFAMLRTALERFIRIMELKLEEVLAVAASANDGNMESVATQQARLQFEKVRSSLNRQLEIQRFTFTKPSDDYFSRPASPLVGLNVQKNKGGKPLAQHWDKLWASIAAQLYNGDLKPNSQAEIERAMKGWFAQRNLDIGDTTIRGRARVLWSELQNEP